MLWVQVDSKLAKPTSKGLECCSRHRQPKKDWHLLGREVDQGQDKPKPNTIGMEVPIATRGGLNCTG